VAKRNGKDYAAKNRVNFCGLNFLPYLCNVIFHSACPSLLRRDARGIFFADLLWKNTIFNVLNVGKVAKNAKKMQKMKKNCKKICTYQKKVVPLHRI